MKLLLLDPLDLLVATRSKRRVRLQAKARFVLQVLGVNCTMLARIDSARNFIFVGVGSEARARECLLPCRRLASTFLV